MNCTYANMSESNITVYVNKLFMGQESRVGIGTLFMQGTNLLNNYVNLGFQLIYYLV